MSVRRHHGPGRRLISRRHTVERNAHERRRAGDQITHEDVRSVVRVVRDEIAGGTFKRDEPPVRADRGGQRCAVPAARAVAVHAHQKRFARRAIADKHVERAVAVVGHQVVGAADEHDEAPVRANAGVVAIGRRAFNSDGGNRDCLRRAAILAGAEPRQDEHSDLQHEVWFRAAIH